MKLFVVLLSAGVIILSACANNSPSNNDVESLENSGSDMQSMQISAASSNQTTSINIETDEGEFLGKREDYAIHWDDDTLDITDKFVLDDETALAIGNAVMENLRGKEFIENTSFFVYSPESSITVVTRGPKDINIDGGSISVAISTEDGRIMKIWLGE